MTAALQYIYATRKFAESFLTNIQRFVFQFYTLQENVDLNRNFPDWRDHERFLADINYDPYSGGRQPETLAIMNWSTEPFVLSANLHSGATLVTFPFDHYKDG